MVAASTSHISAHEVPATVAPFRAWRGLQVFIARGPIKATITRLSCIAIARRLRILPNLLEKSKKKFNVYCKTS